MENCSREKCEENSLFPDNFQDFHFNDKNKEDLNNFLAD